MASRSYAYYLPAGLTPKDIKKTIPAIEYQLSAKVAMTVKGKAVILTVYENQLEKLLPYETIDLSSYKLGLPIGKTYKGNQFILDLNDARPYLIIAGAPGTGKSNLLSVILKQLKENYQPDHVQFYPIDLKLGVELKKFTRGEFEPYCGGFCWEPGGELIRLLKYIDRQIKKRMVLFEEHGLEKIDEYNALPNVEKLPYLLVVIDEYAELRRNEKAEDLIQSILQKGRAAGIRALLCLQRPSATNLSTDIRALITERLSFALPDRTNSEIVLGMAGAEDLATQGRCLLLTGSQLVEAQTMLAK